MDNETELIAQTTSKKYRSKEIYIFDSERLDSDRTILQRVIQRLEKVRNKMSYRGLYSDPDDYRELDSYSPWNESSWSDRGSDRRNLGLRSRTLRLATQAEIEPSRDDNNTDPVIVYLLTDHPRKKKVRELIRYFNSSPFFSLKVTNLPPKAKITITGNMTEEQAIEICRFDEVLTEASNDYPDKYVIVIKDTSIATSTPSSLERLIRTARQFGEWDVCYLTRWLDRCDLYKHPINIKGSMKVLVKTLSPNGTQALLFSPEGRDVIIGRRKMNNGKYFTPINLPLGTKLNQEIVDNNISAISSVPNSFEFDVFQAKRTSDLAKLSDCRRPETKQEGPGAIPLLWFIVIVAIVLLVAWALYAIGPSIHNQETLRVKSDSDSGS